VHPCIGAAVWSLVRHGGTNKAGALEARVSAICQNNVSKSCQSYPPDNKYWFNSWAEAVNGYEEVLEPPAMKRDVCYWVNEQAAKGKKSLGCLNAAGLYNM
jgi:hypothetical protein